MQQYGQCKRVLTLDSVLFSKSFISNTLQIVKKQTAQRLSSIHKLRSSQCSTKTPPTGARWGGFFQDIETGNHRQPTNIIWDTLQETNIFHRNSTFVKILQLICESKRLRLQQCLGRGYVSPRKVCLPMIECQPRWLHICSFFCFTLLLEGENTPKTSAVDCYVEIFVSVVQYVLSGWKSSLPPFIFSALFYFINSKTATHFPISPPAHNKNNLHINQWPKYVEVF